MIAWLKRFLFDETAFVGVARAACFGLGFAVNDGMIDVTQFGASNQLVAMVLVMLGGFVRSSTAASKKEKP